MAMFGAINAAVLRRHPGPHLDGRHQRQHRQHRHRPPRRRGALPGPPGGGPGPRRASAASGWAGSSPTPGQPDQVYDPDNPLADADGNVTRPVVDLSQEMTHLMMASRLYQANLSVMTQARDAYQSALQIGRS